MKKRYYLIPIFAVVLAFLTVSFATFFTTPVTFYLLKPDDVYKTVFDECSVITETSDCFYNAKKIGKIMQFAYKVNPSIENLEVLTTIYNPTLYIVGKQKGHTPTADYLSNAAKYAKKLYETEYTEGESTYYVPYDFDSQDYLTLYWNFNEGILCAKALYLNGQVAESQAVMEELIGMLTPKYYSPWISSMKGYFYLVYSTAEDEMVKQWVTEKEEQLEKMAMTDEELKTYMETYGFLFSNPDYETYIKGQQNWPDYVNDENEP